MHAGAEFRRRSGDGDISRGSRANRENVRRPAFPALLAAARRFRGAWLAAIPFVVALVGDGAPRAECWRTAWPRGASVRQIRPTIWFPCRPWRSISWRAARKKAGYRVESFKPGGGPIARIASWEIAPRTWDRQSPARPCAMESFLARRPLDYGCSSQAVAHQSCRVTRPGRACRRVDNCFGSGFWIAQLVDMFLSDASAK